MATGVLCTEPAQEASQTVPERNYAMRPGVDEPEWPHPAPPRPFFSSQIQESRGQRWPK
jgi:hypothetical protein